MCENQNQQMEKSKKSYYFDSDKFIRDMVHGYVYLTKFDMDLISTAEFQRLRDILRGYTLSLYIY